MKRKMISAKTCYLMGVCGGALQLVAGGIIALGLGDANFLLIAAVAMYGAMLLFLAAGEKGKQARDTRAKLLLLFFLLLLGFLPVPVGPLGIGLSIFLLVLWQRNPADKPLLVAQAFIELAYTIAMTLASTGYTGALPGIYVAGGSLVVAGVARAHLLWRIFRQEDDKTPLQPQ